MYYATHKILALTFLARIQLFMTCTMVVRCEQEGQDHILNPYSVNVKL